MMIGLVVLATACGGSDPDIATSTGVQQPGDADPSPEWGPTAIAATAAPGTELIAGILEISDDCVVLNERGHRQVMLEWPKDRRGWNSDDRTIKFTTGAGPVIELRDQDRVTLSGTLRSPPMAHRDPHTAPPWTGDARSSSRTHRPEPSSCTANEAHHPKQ